MPPGFKKRLIKSILSIWPGATAHGNPRPSPLLHRPYCAAGVRISAPLVWFV